MRKAPKIRNREIADAKVPVPPGTTASKGAQVKDVPAFQQAATRQPIIKGGATSGSPGQIVRFWNRWRENYNALTQLTIARVRSLNEMTQRGDHAYPQWTYRTIERRHPVLKALIDCCEAPLENVNWDVRVKKSLPAGFTEDDATKQKDALKSAYAQIDNLRDALKHLSHADFSGYAHCQKHYLDSEVVHLECLFTFCICRDGLFGDWFWNPDSRSVTMPEQILTAANRIGGDVLPREDFVIREVDRPINEIALENFVRRKLIEKDWSAFDEIFGIPSGVVIMPAGIPPEKVTEYEQAARQISEGGSGAMPYGSDYKKNDMPHDGSALFKNHIDALDSDLVLAGTGGKLKMLVEHAQGNAAGGGGNVRGSSKTQDDTFREIAMARGNDVAQQFHRDFDLPFLNLKFPNEPALVEFCLVTEDEVDVTALCGNVATLKQAGKNVKTEFVQEQTGYEFEDDDEAQPQPNAPGDAVDPKTEKPMATPTSNSKLPTAINNRYAGAAASPEDLNKFAAAHAADLAPLADRFNRILEINDDELFRQKLQDFIAEHGPLAKLLADINADPKAAHVLNDLATRELQTALKS